MISVCTGCAYEQACGRSGLLACTKRKPARWCSCDQLRKALAERDALLRLKCEREAEIARLEADRDKYREKALDGECWRICDFGGCPNIGCDTEEKGYCDTVKNAVDSL